MKFKSAGDKHIEPSSCRFLLDKREEKGIRGIIIKGTLQWGERCCHIPFTATCLLLLKGFIAFTDQSYPDRGWSRENLSQTSSVWCCYSHASVAESWLHRKAFYQRIWGNSSWLSHVTSGRKESECIQRRSKWSSNIQGVPEQAPSLEMLWVIPEFWKCKISANHVIFHWPLLDQRKACPSLVESSFFAQILYTMLYLSWNSRSWQTKCFPYCLWMWTSASKLQPSWFTALS